MTDKISYTVDEAVKATGLGRTSIYERIKMGEIKPAKIGSRTLILRSDLEAMLQRGLAA